MTASDYSDRVSSATATATTTTGTGNTQATSSSQGAAKGMVLEPTSLHLLAGGAIAAVVNAALLV